MRSFFGVLAIFVPSTALRCDLGRAHGISRALHRGPRASPLRLAEGSDDEDLDARIDSSIEAELRKALSEMPASELVESDRRLMDGLVQDVKQGELRQAESSLDRELASVQGALESKLESKISALEGETMAKIDAAVEALRGANPFEDKLSAAAVAGGVAGALSAEIPAEGLVVVAGGGTALGRELLKVLGEGSSWQLRSLELDAPPAPPSGAPGTAGRVETRPFAPFAPSVLKQSVAGAAAVVVVSAAAGGKGGVEAEGVARLVKQLGGGLRRLVFISQHGAPPPLPPPPTPPGLKPRSATIAAAAAARHRSCRRLLTSHYPPLPSRPSFAGTLRCGQLPFSLKNLLGQLDKLRAAEQDSFPDLPRFAASTSRRPPLIAATDSRSRSSPLFRDDRGPTAICPDFAGDHAEGDSRRAGARHRPVGQARGGARAGRQGDPVAGRRLRREDLTHSRRAGGGGGAGAT